MHKINLFAILHCQINQISWKNFCTVQNCIPSQTSIIFTSPDVPDCKRSSRLAMLTVDIAGKVESTMGFSPGSSNPSHVILCNSALTAHGLRVSRRSYSIQAGEHLKEGQYLWGCGEAIIHASTVDMWYPMFLPATFHPCCVSNSTQLTSSPGGPWVASNCSLFVGP